MNDYQERYDRIIRADDVLKHVTSYDDAVKARDELRHLLSDLNRQLRDGHPTKQLSAFEFVKWRQSLAKVHKQCVAEQVKLNTWIKQYSYDREREREAQKARNGGMTDHQKDYRSHLEKLVGLVLCLMNDGVEFSEEEQEWIDAANNFCKEGKKRLENPDT